MPRRYLPRILGDAEGADVLVPATLVGSTAADALDPVSPERAGELADAAVRGGGLWLVKGDRWARVVTGSDLVARRWDVLRDREAVALFDGERPRALTLEGMDPVDLIVPVVGWDPGQTFYFHRESPLFATVPVLHKANHKVTVVRGRVPDGERKLLGRRMVEGQTCGVLLNELGGRCVVPDGEVASDVRAVYAERVRFIVDGLRDLATAAKVLHEWSEQFRDAADAGWHLERPIDNSFLYAVNRRRLRTLLPLPPPGALVPVGPALDVPRPPEPGDPVRPDTDDPAVIGEVTGGSVDPAGPAGAAGHPDLATVAPLAAAAVRLADEEDRRVAAGESGDPARAAVGADGPARAADAAGGPARAAVGAGEPLGAGEIDPGIRLAESLIERFAEDLLDRAVDPTPYHEATRRPDDLPVLRRGVFRRPRGRLLRTETGGRLVAAGLRIDAGSIDVVRGSVPGDVAPLLNATVAADDGIAGDWALCRGAFGFVLAEVGTPLRAIESLSSSASFAHLLDGATRLEEASARLRSVADRLERLAAEGWTLSQPIAGFWLRLRPPDPYG